MLKEIGRFIELNGYDVEYFPDANLISVRDSVSPNCTEGERYDAMREKIWALKKAVHEKYPKHELETTYFEEWYGFTVWGLPN
jgi:hypothetical protein